MNKVLKSNDGFYSLNASNNFKLKTSSSMLFAVVYYLAILTFSLKLPVLSITGSFFLVIIGTFFIRGIPKSSVIGISSVLLYFLLVYFLNFKNSDMLEFVKSFINICLFIISFYFVKMVFKTNSIDNSALEKISLLIFFVAVSQVILLIFFANDFLYFFLDSFSISTAESVDRFEAPGLFGFIRPISIYHEPSFLALISLVLLHIGYIKNGRYSLVNIACICLSMSVTGIASLLLYIIWNKKALLGCTLGVLFVLFSWRYSAFIRLDEVFMAGTSGHERLIKPFIDLAESFDQNILAVPVGNLFPQSNNSLQVLIAYFGVMFGVMIVAIFSCWRCLPVIICLLFTNGAFLTPDGGILLASVLYAGYVK